MDIEKQIRYWIEGAESDLETASILIENRRFLNGLFFCHLSIEKSLKAHFVKVNNAVPPKTHNLILLLNKANLELDIDDQRFLGVMANFQIEGRYPDYHPVIPSVETVNYYFDTSKRLILWLKQKL